MRDRTGQKSKSSYYDHELNILKTNSYFADKLSSPVRTPSGSTVIHCDPSCVSQNWKMHDAADYAARWITMGPINGTLICDPSVPIWPHCGQCTVHNGAQWDNPVFALIKYYCTQSGSTVVPKNQE